MPPPKQALLSAVLLPLFACSRPGPAPTKAAAAGAPAVPVTVAAATQRSTPVEIRAIGNVQPYSTVSIRCEVGGRLEKVEFTEGQDVHQGDILFVVDPRPFQAALQQTQANLEKDKASAENAKADAERYQKLFEAGVIPRQQRDQYRATADALVATVAADEAAVETARLQLSYTTIRSPIDGRTGSLLVHLGNLVQANATTLVVINQIQPIFVNFSVPGQNLAEIKRYMGGGLRVEARPKEGGAASLGRLTFVDNAVDMSTGTILLKGTFANQDRALWPGEFVDATLDLTMQPNALLVPTQAIQNGQQGQYVFVVKPDATVESRQVTVNRTIEQQAVISSGLAPGETVVTDGQLRLAPGVKVRIVQGRKISGGTNASPRPRVSASLLARSGALS